MFDTCEYDILMRLGSLVSEIHFLEVPDAPFLEALADHEVTNKSKIGQNHDIAFHLPLDAVASIDEYESSFASSYIHSANFETDLFMEWQELYSFPNLRSLVLTCTNGADYVDDNDLGKMQLTLLNLSHLRSIVFDVSKMQPHIVENIEAVMRFPFDSKLVEFKAMGYSRKKLDAKKKATKLTRS